MPSLPWAFKTRRFYRDPSLTLLANSRNFIMKIHGCVRRWYAPNREKERKNRKGGRDIGSLKFRSVRLCFALAVFLRSAESEPLIAGLIVYPPVTILGGLGVQTVIALLWA